MKTKCLFTAVLSMCAVAAHAWDYEGHRTVNQIALASLPANFPAFVLTPDAQTRIAFLAGEADRWRNITDAKNERGLELGFLRAWININRTVCKEESSLLVLNDIHPGYTLYA